MKIGNMIRTAVIATLALVATDAGDVMVSEIFVSLNPREKWSKATSQSELLGLMEKHRADYTNTFLALTYNKKEEILKATF